jgi:hypothetical protein
MADSPSTDGTGLATALECQLRRHQVPERWGGRTGGQEVLLAVLAWGENWRLGSVDKADGARADAATISSTPLFLNGRMWAGVYEC